VKFVTPRPYADPEAAARKLMALAFAYDSPMPPRGDIEVLNYPFIDQLVGAVADYSAGMKLLPRSEVARNAPQRRPR
jgi:hypothetical protein